MKYIFKIICCLLIIISSKIIHSNTNLDKSFGKNGIVRTDFGKNAGTLNRIVPAMHIAIQPDGKILMIGDVYSEDLLNSSINRLTLIRYNVDGSLDESFGEHGKLLIHADSQFGTLGIDIVIQNNGKIVLLGRHSEQMFLNKWAKVEAMIIRLNNDGSYDKSFGINGIVKEHNNQMEQWSNFFRIAIQNDSKIVLGGNIGINYIDKDEVITDQIYVARYNYDGTPDLNFGHNGKVITKINTSNRPKTRTEGREADGVFSLKLQKDGKIIVVGYSDDDSKQSYNGTDLIDDTDCHLTRYDSTGKLDTSFGPDKNGMVITSTSKGSNQFFDVNIQTDGKIVAVGTSKNTTTNKFEFLIARYLENGILDSTFGKDGIVLTSIGSDAFAKNFTIQDDGKILVTGLVKFEEHHKFVLVKYMSDGKLDTTFGDNGIIIVSLGNYDDKSYCLAVQDDKKIVVGGSSFNGKHFDFALIRVN